MHPSSSCLPWLHIIRYWSFDNVLCLLPELFVVFISPYLVKILANFSLDSSQLWLLSLKVLRIWWRLVNNLFDFILIDRLHTSFEQTNVCCVTSDLILCHRLLIVRISCHLFYLHTVLQLVLHLLTGSDWGRCSNSVEVIDIEYLTILDDLSVTKV